MTATDPRLGEIGAIPAEAVEAAEEYLSLLMADPNGDYAMEARDLLAAQRIRFGILAARHILERHRLTEWQQDYIEGCELAGWKVGDTRKAFDHEWDAAQARAYARRLRF